MLLWPGAEARQSLLLLLPSLPGQGGNQQASSWQAGPEGRPWHCQQEEQTIRIKSLIL